MVSYELPDGLLAVTRRARRDRELARRVLTPS